MPFGVSRLSNPYRDASVQLSMTAPLTGSFLLLAVSLVLGYAGVCISTGAGFAYEY